MFISTEHPLHSARVVFIEFASLAADAAPAQAFLADCLQATRSVVVAATGEPEAEVTSWLEQHDLDDLVDGVVSPWDEDAFTSAASALAAHPLRCAVLGTSWAFLSAATEADRVVALAPVRTQPARRPARAAHEPVVVLFTSARACPASAPHLSEPARNG
jgi:hypothetical protein